MYNEDKLSPAQQELESALSQIRPAQDALNHELFIFKAGRASVNTGRSWQMVSAALTVLLLCSVLIRPELDMPRREASPHLVALDETASAHAPRPSEPVDASAYIALRQSIVRRGLNALPSGSGLGSSTQRVHQREWLESLL
jgi:hypothetical protein